MNFLEWSSLRSTWDLASELSLVVQSRKLFLLGVAYLSRVEAHLPNETNRFALQVTREYALGQASARDVLECWSAAEYSANEGIWFHLIDDDHGDCDCVSCQAGREQGGEMIAPGARSSFSDPASFAGRAAVYARLMRRLGVDVERHPEVVRQEVRAQYELYCDIVGDPLMPPRPAPAYVRLPEVKRLLSCIASMERIDPVALCALADALEEAGCSETDLVAHCRSLGPHTAGCWALEILLGRGQLRLATEEVCR